MAMIKNAPMFFIKCDPKRPNNQFNKENPKWEVQLRTSDPEMVKYWKSLDLQVKVLTVKDPEDEDVKVPVKDEKGNKIYRVNKTKADPVKFVNGQLEDIDPNTVGNGSIGNIRVYQYESVNATTKEKSIVSMLMAVQVTKHIVYVPKAREDDFDTTDTETIIPEDKEDGDHPLGDGAKKATKPVDEDEF
jgi:hypothetical protein